MTSPALQTHTVEVIDSNGAYTTRSVQGKRSSSTNSPVAAALSLALKLWPNTGTRTAELVGAASLDRKGRRIILVRITYAPDAEPAP